jgi:hypothetical protein
MTARLYPHRGVRFGYEIHAGFRVFTGSCSPGRVEAVHPLVRKLFTRAGGGGSLVRAEAVHPLVWKWFIGAGGGGSPMRAEVVH